MKTFRLPATAIALSFAVFASAAGASAETTDTSKTQAQPVQTYSVAILQTQALAPRTVGNVNVSTQPWQLSDFTSRALTPLQLNAAYDRFVQAALHIDPAIAHTP